MQQYFENRQCIKFEDIQNQKKKYENIIIANERIDEKWISENFTYKNFDYPEKPLKYKHIRRISD